MCKKRAYINATIINGDKLVPIIEKGFILVNEDGEIFKTGSMDQLNLPEGYEVEDLNGKYIMPGLINTHLHIFYDGSPRKEMVGEEMDKYIKMLHTEEGEKYLLGVAKNCIDTLVNSGVTAIRDVGSVYNHDIIMRNEIKSGKRVGPHVVASGSLIVPTAGHGNYFPTMHIADGPWEGRKAVRTNYARGVDWIKICSTGGVSDARYIGEAGKPHYTFEEIEAICDEAHRRNLMVATHCQSTKGMREALLAGVDSIEHGGAIEDDMISLFLDNPKSLRGYTALCPTISAPDALIKSQAKFTSSKENAIVFENCKIIAEGCKSGLLTAIKHGIPVCVGTDAAVPYVSQYNTYKELIYINDACETLSEIDVIQIATKDSAEIIGLGKITGTLDEGKSADFIVLDGNPAKDLNVLKNPLHVIAQGNFIKTPLINRIKEIEDIF
ncbi:hypothetical protein AN396_01615 [Candidatus Epulonipiscium fishelsonii]|uniref:Uncharacterized protein n=1 Tax=Candidatus Epulonipiscium fishelsonii TaxID=77094 RepID=A0ACC8XH49_9FIRM|nr:hypothetical protein AN396_01615 [Epulopiscium sp. SCG-B11WGA-EpuloA1]